MAKANEYERVWGVNYNVPKGREPLRKLLPLRILNNPMMRKNGWKIETEISKHEPKEEEEEEVVLNPEPENISEILSQNNQVIELKPTKRGRPKSKK